MNKKTAFLIAIFIFITVFSAAWLYTGHSKNSKIISDALSVTTGQLSPQDSNPIDLPTAAAMMQPHKALYHISMVSASSGSQIVNIRGDMFFEWRPSCDAYTTDHRFNLTYEYSDSPAMQITSDFSTWEKRDGSALHFNSRRSRDGEVYEEIRGAATRWEDGSGKITYTLPTPTEMELPTGFVFPMQHTVQMLAHMNKTDTPFLNLVLFDGSDLDGPIEVNAFYGTAAKFTGHTENIPDKINEALINAPARNVHMAFFPILDQEATGSDYEMNALFHDNGVMSDMVIKYQDFSIRQDLVALDKLDIPPLNCD